MFLSIIHVPRATGDGARRSRDDDARLNVRNCVVDLCVTLLVFFVVLLQVCFFPLSVLFIIIAFLLPENSKKLYFW